MSHHIITNEIFPNIILFLYFKKKEYFQTGKKKITSWISNLFKISVKLPPHSRLRKRPSEQGLPSQSSRPPVTMPGTKTTGWSAVVPPFLNLTPGASGTLNPGKFAGKQWYRNSSSHQVVHKYPIIQQQESIHLHCLWGLLCLFLPNFSSFTSVLPIFVFSLSANNFTGSRKMSFRHRTFEAIASKSRFYTSTTNSTKQKQSGALSTQTIKPR